MATFRISMSVRTEISCRNRSPLMVMDAPAACAHGPSQELEGGALIISQRWHNLRTQHEQHHH